MKWLTATMVHIALCIVMAPGVMHICVRHLMCGVWKCGGALTKETAMHSSCSHQCGSALTKERAMHSSCSHHVVLDINMCGWRVDAGALTKARAMHSSCSHHVVIDLNMFGLCVDAGAH